MIRPRWMVLAARLLFLGYVFFTAAYCLLCYIPFTYQQVHVGELLPWLTRLVHLHAWLFWPAFAAGLFTVFPEKRAGAAQRIATGFAILGVIAGVLLAVHPLLPSLKNDAGSLAWSIVSLLTLPLMATVDWLHAARSLAWRPAEEESEQIFITAAQSALFVAAVYFLTVVLRIANGTSLDFSPSQWASALMWSVLSHLLFFFLIFVLFDLALLGVSYIQTTGKFAAGSAIGLGVVVLLVVLAVRGVVFPPLAFEGAFAWITACAIALCLVSYAAGTGLRLRDISESEGATGLQLLVEPLRLPKDRNWFLQPVLLTALALFAWLATARVSRLDWGFVVQKMIAMLVWSAAFAILYNQNSRSARYNRLWAYAAGVLLLAGYTALVVAQPRTKGVSGAPTPIGQVLDGFSGYDISFRLADQLLRPQLNEHTGTTGNFYSYLAENTNIPRSVHVEPVDIRLVPRLSPATGVRPNIFIFVIDSLRRDYLSPYNAEVKFTPAIASLANDSVVFRNAFTRYGGTGLSEPSIWVGGEMLHQQYETPFGSMNSLQKLLEVNGYREWISRDNILQQVVPDSRNLDELDKQIGTMHYDLCTTLGELTQRLPSLQGGPVFVYTQAQNIHVSVIDREGRSVPQGESFPPAFNAAYASRLQKMDACMGKFLQALKRQGQYDNSLIVLTSDHGDSLGENGRWGHAYTIFPEVVRVPLIVHLPAAWRANVQEDAQSVAFLTDITPSLYYLLGQKDLMRNELFGHPLFTASLEEQRSYRSEAQLLVSSYGPVYGLLTENGRQLYIADGVNYRDYAFALAADGSSREEALTEERRAAAQREIREQVDEIARFYGWQRGAAARK